MQPIKFPGSTPMVAPKDWKKHEGKAGECKSLPVLARGIDGSNVTRYISVWGLSPDERRRVVEGGNIILVVYGAQPPVFLDVTDAQGEPAWEPFPEASCAEVDLVIRQGCTIRELRAKTGEQDSTITKLDDMNRQLHEENEKLLAAFAGFSAAALSPEAIQESIKPDVRCHCDHCQKDGNHASDCAVHNSADVESGPCDCPTLHGKA